MLTTFDCETRHGVMRAVEGDVWVSRSLRELGEYSSTELHMMEMILGLQSSGRYDGTIVEAGAYIGDLTVPLSRLCRELIAFEPQEEIRDILSHNLRVNKCDNVTVFPYALGSVNEILTYETCVESPGSTMMGQGEGKFLAEVRTLDDLNLSPTFLKADVEGMELALLAGGIETLSRSRCTLFLERETVTVLDAPPLGEVLETLGYEQYPMSFPMWTPGNFRRAPNTFGSTASFMTLGIPRRELA